MNIIVIKTSEIKIWGKKKGSTLKHIMEDELLAWMLSFS